MEHLLTLFFGLGCVVSTASAWSFTWTNAENKTFVEHSHEPVNCSQVDQAAGKDFRWNPEDDGLSIWMWANRNCAGYRAGWSPAAVWDHTSSTELGSFRVALEGDSSTSSATSLRISTSTTTRATTTTATTYTTRSTQTPTSTPASETPTGEPTSSSGSPISGGAIAGIVIGAVAAVAIIGLLFFFLGRRRRRRASPVDPATDTDPAPGPVSATQGPPVLGGKSELDSVAVNEIHSDETKEFLKNSTPVPDPVMSPAYQTASVGMMVELPGHPVTVETGDTQRLNELEGRRLPRKE